VKNKLSDNKYTPVAGLPELRDAIASYYQNYFHSGWIESGNVTVTAGAKPALTAVFMSLLNPGDEVIIPKPAWVSYQSEVEVAGGKAVFVETTKKFDLDVSAISNAITKKTKAIVINSPNNPTGKIYSRKPLDALAELVNLHDVTLVSDDIYSRLVYSELYLPLNSEIDPAKLVIVNGFSKSQALTGWRIGYCISSQDLQSKISSLLSHTNGNAPVTSQHAAIAALEREDEPEFLHDLVDKRDQAIKLLQDIDIVSFHEPEGGFYVFVDIRSFTNNSDQFCQDLLESKGVGVVPGEAFEMPGYIRISYATNSSTLSSGLKKMKEFIEESKS
ncbi:MAG: aminotransferase class I/II-fold pyridoxal phosphate-dependent enzyme, partial [Candidatus Saccharimonadales bacterium]|nr:aminotransferase class I/II-fold pyridoxal phosphate-dependent enzyme [Candidatus Saccharimonadales bacterium]